MPTNDEVSLRVPAELVGRCERIFHVLGLSADEAVRLFLAQVSLRRGLPFAVAMPPETSVGQEDDSLALAPARGAKLDAFVSSEQATDPEDGWLRAAASSDVFAFLANPAEDVYSATDGKPFRAAL